MHAGGRCDPKEGWYRASRTASVQFCCWSCCRDQSQCNSNLCAPKVCSKGHFGSFGSGTWPHRLHHWGNSTAWHGKSCPRMIPLRLLHHLVLDVRTKCSSILSFYQRKVHSKSAETELILSRWTLKVVLIIFPPLSIIWYAGPSEVCYQAADEVTTDRAQLPWHHQARRVQNRHHAGIHS